MSWNTRMTIGRIFMGTGALIAGGMAVKSALEGTYDVAALEGGITGLLTCSERFVKKYCYF